MVGRGLPDGADFNISAAVIVLQGFDFVKQFVRCAIRIIRNYFCVCGTDGFVCDQSRNVIITALVTPGAVIGVVNRIHLADLRIGLGLRISCVVIFRTDGFDGEFEIGAVCNRSCYLDNLLVVVIQPFCDWSALKSEWIEFRIEVASVLISCLLYTSQIHTKITNFLLRSAARSPISRGSPAIATSVSAAAV